MNTKEKIFDVIIPRNIKLAEAPSHGTPICIYDPKSNGAIAYNDLAMEILKNDKKIITGSQKNKTSDEKKKTKSRSKGTGNSKRATRKKVVIDKIKEKKEKKE